MQYILARRGYPPGAIDAVFGPMTDTALQELPGRLGLSAPTAGRARRRSPALRRGVGIERDDAGGERAGALAAARAGSRSATASARRAAAAARHTGLDFPVPSGTRVGAAGVGVTEFAGWNYGGYGNLVVVRHRLGYTTWYAHLSSITTWVGEEVRAARGSATWAPPATRPARTSTSSCAGTRCRSTRCPYLLGAVATRSAPAAALRRAAVSTGGAWPRRVPDPRAAREVPTGPRSTPAAAKNLTRAR